MIKNKSLLYCFTILIPYNQDQTDRSVYFAEKPNDTMHSEGKNK